MLSNRNAASNCAVIDRNGRRELRNKGNCCMQIDKIGFRINTEHFVSADTVKLYLRVKVSFATYDTFDNSEQEMYLPCIFHTVAVGV